MRHVFFLSIFFAVTILFGNQEARAQAVTGTPNVFRVTLKKVEVSQDGSNFTTIVSGNQSFDIASAAAGASVGSFGSIDALAAGTYTQMRITLANQIGLKGSITRPADATYYTTASGSSTNSADEAELTFIVTSAPPNFSLDLSAGEMTTTENVNITLQDGQGSTTVTVKFDVTNAFQLNPDNSFSPNGVSTSVTTS